MPLFPGFGGTTSVPAAPPPPPTSEDPAVKDAQEKLRLSEKRRKGRGATLLTDQQDGLGDAAISRPEARDGAQVLGQ